MELALLVLLGLAFLFSAGRAWEDYLERHDAELDREWLEEQRKQDKEP